VYLYMYDFRTAPAPSATRHLSMVSGGILKSALFGIRGQGTPRSDDLVIPGGSLAGITSLGVGHSLSENYLSN